MRNLDALMRGINAAVAQHLGQIVTRVFVFKHHFYSKRTFGLCLIGCTAEDGRCPAQICMRARPRNWRYEMGLRGLLSQPGVTILTLRVRRRRRWRRC